MSKRLQVGIDGNAIYVGLGELYDGKYIFETIIKDDPFKSDIKSIRGQANDLIEKWLKEYPEEGRLPFDYMDGLTL